MCVRVCMYMYVCGVGRVCMCVCTIRLPHTVMGGFNFVFSKYIWNYVSVFAPPVFWL